MSTSATHNAIMEAGGKDRLYEFKMADHPATEATETSEAQPAIRGLETLFELTNNIITSLLARALLRDVWRTSVLVNCVMYVRMDAMNNLRAVTAVRINTADCGHICNRLETKVIHDKFVRIKILLDDLRVTATQVCVTAAKLKSENVSKLSNDLLLARGNTLQSGEDSLKLPELMALCTTLQTRVLDLEITKTTQANEIASLKRRVKKLEQKKRPSTYGLKRLYKVGSSKRVTSSDEEGLGEEDASKQGRIADIDANKDIYLVNVHTNEDMFVVNDLYGDGVIVDNVDIVKSTEETRSVVEEVIVVIKKAKLVSAAKETVNAAATSVSTTSTIPVNAATTTTTTTTTDSDVEIPLTRALA
ncbi:hypothetical protein Tco_0971476 [Tanacetum coccineum]